jgi:hypothetical protein
MSLLLCLDRSLIATSLNNFTAGQPIRYSEGFDSFLRFSAGSGVANALPLPVITKFVPTEA